MNDVSSGAPASVSAREVPFEFHATGSEYFRIWIVNLLLTIVTLGIYSAWAKVRRLRYFYGSTTLDGSSFDYHGRPAAILKGRLIVVGAYAVFVAAAQFWPALQLLAVPLALVFVPWIIVRARLFQMRMTSWRGLRFNFHGQYGGAMAAYVGWPVLGAITLTALWPLALWKQVNFIVTNTSYGTQRFGFASLLGPFYRFFYAALGMAVAVIFVLAFAGAAALIPLGGDLQEAAHEQRVSLLPMFSALAFYLFLGVIVGGYFRSRFVNASIGGAFAGPHRLSSTLRARSLMWIYFTNILGMVVTLGLFYPWAKVRALRYQLDNTRLLAGGDLGQFAASADDGTSALAEEAGDFLDVDFGL
jgi:uncharacterized membrane protein YjgN (DUF898 family)